MDPLSTQANPIKPEVLVFQGCAGIEEVGIMRNPIDGQIWVRWLRNGMYTDKLVDNHDEACVEYNKIIDIIRRRNNG